MKKKRKKVLHRIKVFSWDSYFFFYFQNTTLEILPPQEPSCPVLSYSPGVRGGRFIFQPKLVWSVGRDLLYNSRSNMQAWGLIVLLVSKAAGHCLNADALAKRGNSSSGVLNDQRALAEIAEMIRTSHLMHNGIVNLHRGMFSEPLDFNDMCCSNKIAMLSGDYLLAKSYSKLAILKNQQV